MLRRRSHHSALKARGESKAPKRERAMPAVANGLEMRSTTRHDGRDSFVAGGGGYLEGGGDAAAEAGLAFDNQLHPCAADGGQPPAAVCIYSVETEQQAHAQLS